MSNPSSVAPRVVDIVGHSDPGLVRGYNEDCLLIADLDQGSILDARQGVQTVGERGPLLVVCDGVGGSAGGDVASELACRVIYQEVQRAPVTQLRAVLARNLRRAVRKANLEVAAAAAADKKLRGMGTTVSAAAIVGNTAVLAQVGDSRVYVLRGRRLTQITRDQSVVAALVQAGQLSEQAAPYSMQQGRILQALGADEDVEVSLSIAELRAGDRLVLCSDGLHGLVSDLQIAEACGIESLGEAVAALVSLAHSAGGHDNITVVLAEVSGAALSAPVPGEDELRFVEMDPSLEGESALSTTSIVSRRLAHRAGLRKDAWPRLIPATAQHPTVLGDETEGPAQRALAQGGKIGLLAWLLIACLCLAGLFFALSWL